MFQSDIQRCPSSDREGGSQQYAVCIYRLSHREKLGWLEQVHLNGPGLLYNYDLTAFAPQIMQNMADAQHRNGAMPSTAPEYVVFEGPGMDAFAESPEWGGALVVFPYILQKPTGTIR